MSDLTRGPATRAAQQAVGRMSSTSLVRPYPVLPADAPLADLVAAALRALVHARDADGLRTVLAAVVGDLGGALVPARFEPDHALPIDVSLGIGEPVVPVAPPASVAALRLAEALPGLVHDARALLSRSAAPTSPGPFYGPADASTYLAHVAAGEREQAVRLVHGAVSGGTPVPSVVQDVLAPAQREVGERWYRGEWSVADEHAATAISETAAAVLPRHDGLARVVFACPDGEWHTLPSRLASLAATGVHSTLLGPGLPADDLRRYLEAIEPDALALSCTVGTSLLAATDAIAVAHAAGVAVVVGGRAVDGHRAARLGADAHLDDAPALAGVVLGLRPGATPAPDHEAWVAHSVSDDVLAIAVQRHAAASSAVRALNSVQRGAVAGELRWLVRHGAAALVCADVGLLDDALTWTAGVDSRVLPDGTLDDAVLYAADAVEPESPRVAALLTAAVEHRRGLAR